ncbi:esterase/lipase family protein [Variovorax sp. M-6]|uniref:esterase/lipase family protein n=1 Tax=Variovorax sp. M-6 TaxID=3233041 RepID=UPI003F950866
MKAWSPTGVWPGAPTTAHRGRRFAAFAMLLASAWLLCGCAVVSVSSVSPSGYLAERRSDALTTGRLSLSAREVLRIVGIADCRAEPAACREQLAQAPGITEEQRLSTLSELWLEAALAAGSAAAQQPQLLPAAQPDAELDAWIETARHAWAYLFFTDRRPGDRAFEERQTQVRDYYNYAVQQAMDRLFRNYASGRTGTHTWWNDVIGWRLSVTFETSEPGRETRQPEELVAATSLRFTGLRNTYQRDGFGAALVAVLPEAEASAKPAPFVENRYPAITALIRFEGKSLQEVMNTRKVELALYDPYERTQATLAGQTVPLTANFTAGYGLWLARSGFSTEALSSLFGLSDGIVRPRIQLMQPYDPKRHIVVMLHGLASSPEAWVNVANEVMGDDTLRRHYQIWQVYYPTNAPLALNLHNIRQALDATLTHYDSQGTALASKDLVLVGHSMGGVLARLLASDSGDKMWETLPPDVRSRRAYDKAFRSEMDDYLEFHPQPKVSRAIFIAAPHRGTSFAENRLARYAANLVTLPVAMLDEVGDLTRMAARLRPPESGKPPLRIPNSIDNLSDRNPFVRLSSTLPINPAVRYHSIIGRESAEGDLLDSTDGVVPYTSSHLAGAQSERVIVSWHSVQENPQAILEIRRILREHLDERAQATQPPR